MRRLKDRLKGLATGAKHRERISESQQVEKQFWLERYREHRKVTRADEETAAEFRVSDRTIANRRRLRNWAQEAG
jgi:hypothetical protein